MKSINLLIVGVLATATYFLIPNQPKDLTANNTKIAPIEVVEEGKSLVPYDQWLIMRSYPDGFEQDLYLERINEIKLHATYMADTRDVDLTMDWLQEGPGNIGGRINVLTVDPADNSIIYAGASNGGVFKSTDGGTNWDPIFDAYAFLAIGSISIDPDNSNIIYVGTGDRNFGGGSHIGNGIYKSTDAGLTWNEMGLEETGAITEIIIDPSNPNRLFASTLGNPFVKNAYRGVYRSEDGGASWTNKLFLADSAGVIDMVMHPTNPDILYASGYNRTRSYLASNVKGPQARIFKTINGGDSWTMLTTGLPMDEDDSRIGLAISNDDPSTLYALYVNGDNLDIDDVFKTTNGGVSWSPLNVHGGAANIPEDALGGFGWYFGEIYLNPYNNNQLIVPGVEMYQSLDAGADWERNVPAWWTYEVHADKHAVAFLDDNSYIIATDGGLYKTDNNGDSWSDIENIPITQFYHIDIHPTDNGIYGGGAQDNGSMSGNAASFNDWERLYGGDGFRVTFLEEEPGAAYFETQNGHLRHVSALGDATSVSASTPGDDRVNWDMPYLINEGTGDLFIGTAHIQWMSGAPFGVYEYISEDLTKIGTGEATSSERYRTITEIDQPHNRNDLLYVGTSDGLVWRGEKTGGSWEWFNCTSAPLPNQYVTGIKCSPNNDGTVYISFTGYKNDEDIAYLYKSSDYGNTWESISSDLPSTTVNDILIVPNFEADEYLFAALDGGVYFSSNNGASWDYTGVGLPFCTISELGIDVENKKLIAGTYARSMWSYDISWIDNVDPPVDETGIEEFEYNRINIYPNPVQDVVYFEEVNANQIEIYDQQGKLVIAKKVLHLDGYSKVNLEILKTGIYFFKVGSYSGSLLKK